MEVEFKQVTTQITTTNAITTARVIIRGFDLARSKIFLRKLESKSRSGSKVRANYCKEKYKTMIADRKTSADAL